MEHEPASDWGADQAVAYKKKTGAIMVIIYGVIYGGFILINTLIPKIMGKTVLVGVNLAVTYGIGLILLAAVLGIIYNVLCTKKEDQLNHTKGDNN